LHCIGGDQFFRLENGPDFGVQRIEGGASNLTGRVAPGIGVRSSLLRSPMTMEVIGMARTSPPPT